MQNKTWLKWSEEEIELLKIHWKSSTMEILLNTFPNRKYTSLMLKATELGIKSEIKRKRKGSLEFLNNINIQTAYWWGFIMADGHLTKKGELIIQLNKKDENHLNKLALLLNTKTNIIKENFIILRIQDKNFGKKWLDIFNINTPKTYTPPNLSLFYNKELLLPFLIGLIDGDGCIWKSKNWLNLRIELHSNWFSELQIISNNLKEFYDIECKVKTTKRGTSKIDINTKKDLKILKDYIKNVEFMERKWSKLDTL
jgi:hypothetical protein